jgi:dolichyl-phosphate-mannose-protein mannosyltransferase
MDMKKRLFLIYKWEYFWLALIILITLFLHFTTINIPHNFIFDEKYYVQDARNILTTHHYEQTLGNPPLGKLFVTAGMVLFGDNPFGWRFFSVIFGSLSLILFYLICRKLNLSRSISSIAVYIHGFENLTFIQASIGTLDVYLYTMILATLLFYLNRKYLFSGILLGLSVIIKVSGILAAPTIFIHWLFSKSKKTLSFFSITIPFLFSVFLLMPIFDFVIYHHFANPLIRIKEIFGLSLMHKFSNFTHEALSRPWEWVLNYNPLPYWKVPKYIMGISFSVWILIIPIFIYLIYKAIKRDEAGLFALSWFFGLYILWIPVSILTDRVSYLYYFYPAIGSICLGITLAIRDLLLIKNKYKWIFIILIIGYLIYHFIDFARFSTFFSFY